MKHIIFDMDGVLIDSEPIHQQIIFEVFELLKIPLGKDYIQTLTGMSAIPMWEKTKNDANLAPSATELLNFHKQYFYKKLPDLEIKEVENAKKVVKKLKKDGYHLAVASSSAKNLILHFLEKLEITKFFDVIISGDDVKYSKPSPEIFLKVADFFGLLSENFWVIEDSKNGVTAAKSAGMNCIGFQNPHSGNQNLSQADKIIHSMEEILNFF